MNNQLIAELQEVIQQLDEIRTDVIQQAMAANDPLQGTYLLGQAAAYEETRVLLLDILRYTISG